MLLAIFALPFRAAWFTATTSRPLLRRLFSFVLALFRSTAQCFINLLSYLCNLRFRSASQVSKVFLSGGNSFFEVLRALVGCCRGWCRPLEWLWSRYCFKALLTRRCKRVYD